MEQQGPPEAVPPEQSPGWEGGPFPAWPGGAESAQPPPPGYPPPPYPDPSYAYPGAGYPERRWNGLAIASFVLSLLWLSGLGALLAVVLGAVAIRQTNRAQGWEKGHGLAVAGVVIGVLGLVLLVVVVLGLAVGGGGGVHGHSHSVKLGAGLLG